MKKFKVTVWANGTESETWELETNTREEALEQALEGMNMTVYEIEDDE